MEEKERNGGKETEWRKRNGVEEKGKNGRN